MFFADYRFLLCPLNTIHFFVWLWRILTWRPTNELLRLDFSPVRVTFGVLVNTHSLLKGKVYKNLIAPVAT